MDNNELPAFPTATKQGLTKREAFVKDILAGISANPAFVDCDADKAARIAIDQADRALELLEQIPFGASLHEAVHVDN